MTPHRSCLLLCLLIAPCCVGAEGPVDKPNAGGWVIEVAKPCPPVIALASDGNALLPEDLKGKYTLLVFETTKGLKEKDRIQELTKVRRNFAGDNRFRILSVCTDVAGSEQNLNAWSDFLLKQGTVDYGDGKRRFIDDSKWLHYFENHSIPTRSTAMYGVSHDPELFLIGPDGRFLAVRIALKDLQDELKKALH